MGLRRSFAQVDVFTTVACLGNPVAVVLDGAGLATEDMQRFARWTNLSETTFVLPPTTSEADYRVRIFTPAIELPFAGHPTLGTCHAWLTSGQVGQHREVVVQECGAGLVAVRRVAEGLAFAAPPLVRSGPVDEAFVRRMATSCGSSAPRSSTPNGWTTGRAGSPPCSRVPRRSCPCSRATSTSTWGSWDPTRRDRRRRSRFERSSRPMA